MPTRSHRHIGMSTEYANIIPNRCINWYCGDPWEKLSTYHLVLSFSNLISSTSSFCTWSLAFSNCSLLKAFGFPCLTPFNCRSMLYKSLLSWSICLFNSVLDTLAWPFYKAKSNCHQAFDVGVKWVKSSMSWWSRISQVPFQVAALPFHECSHRMLCLTHLAPTSKAWWQTGVNHINILSIIKKEAKTSEKRLLQHWTNNTSFKWTLIPCSNKVSYHW